MLKMTSVLDFTMLLMLEKGIGGILYIAISYNWDNNLYINGSDENNKSESLIYLDAHYWSVI